MTVIVFLAACSLAAFLLYGLYNSREVRFRTIRLHPAAGSGDGGGPVLKILHLSDIHKGRFTGRGLDSLETLGGKVWDFVFVTGDLIEDDTGIEPAAEAIGKLKARYGKFAVLGNHDYFSLRPRNIAQWFKVIFGDAIENQQSVICVPNDIDRLLEALERSGVRVLRNEVVEGVTEQGIPFQIFGIDDPCTEQDDPAGLYRRKQVEALRLVLIHCPLRLKNVRPIDPEIVMCGHTHGGQVRLPWLGALRTASDAPRRAASGLISLDGCRVHISSGIGAGINFPIRFNSPPEITELLLPQQYTRS
ncbi:MAG: metallophosphoesterase [Candidatus Glassbacteria bacterium]|nr:metallophosphoesterase [Candidatus Glassbacteria bacterium]